MEASYLRQWKDITARGDQGLVSLLAYCPVMRCHYPTPVMLGAAARSTCPPAASCFVAQAPASAVSRKSGCLSPPWLPLPFASPATGSAFDCVCQPAFMLGSLQRFFVRSVSALLSYWG